MTRAERAAIAERLYAEGMNDREIAEAMGISRSYAASLRSDPTGTGERARKDSYRVPCATGCGKLVNGSDGKPKPGAICADCAALASHEGRYWTRERIIETFRRFAEVAGRAPAVTDTGQRKSVQRRLSDERIRESDTYERLVGPLPPPDSVYRELGSWHGAVLAAGLVPCKSGSPSHRGRRAAA